MLKGQSSSRLLAMYAAAWLLLNFPLLALWDRDITVAGVPLLPVALFVGWGALIAWAGWVTERSND